MVVVDGLKDEKIYRLISICKAAVEFFNQSTKALNKLKEMQEQMGKPIQKLINSTPTRWISTLNKILRVLENKEVLEPIVSSQLNYFLLKNMIYGCRKNYHYFETYSFNTWSSNLFK